MSKRRAGTELTHDNWDQEVEEEEEAGVFQTADHKVIAKRAIKKAKRRFPGGEEGEAADSPSSNPFSAFKGFSGFSATAATTKKPDLSFGATADTTKKPGLSFSAAAATTKKPDLSFGATADTTKKPGLSFGAAAATTKKPDLTFSSRENKPKVACTPAESTAPVISSFVIKSSPKPTSTTSTPTESKSVNGSSSSTTATNMNPEYSKQLKSLNQSVSAWIQQHVNDNPLCDLTPVFEDYKKHLLQIESKYSQKNTIAPAASAPASSSASSTTASATSTTTSSFGGFNFVKSAASTTTAAAPSQSSFSFKPTSSASTGAAPGTTTSGFSFLKSSTDSSAGGAAQTKPFSFGLAQAPSTASKTEASGAGGDENEPPKAEFKQVEEKDALYSKRCKLFYKKDETFKDRGVGMLYLKKTGERGQILLRADTNLGNVILNVGIHASMPATRQGKNNVLIMTAMNPPINEKCPKCNKKYPSPQESNRCDTGCAQDVGPLLLRVKTGEDADQLLEEINKLKE